MKNILAVLLLMFFLTSCQENQSTTSSHKTDTDQIKNDSTSNLISDLPIHIDSTAYLIHPIGNFKIGESSKAYFYGSSSGRSNNVSNSNYRSYQISGEMSNLKFQHLDSEKLHQLTDATLLINSVTFLHQINESIGKQFLVYNIIDHDSNADDELNGNDVNALYISGIDGENFKKLTQEDEELVDWKVIQSKNRLYFRTIEDQNNDDVFDNKDVVKYRYVDLEGASLKVTTYKPI
ncbi:MAG: hypothetical protein ACTJF0_01660 [Psychroflexus halocasei]